jgi:hypothetical protein
MRHMQGREPHPSGSIAHAPTFSAVPWTVCTLPSNLNSRHGTRRRRAQGRGALSVQSRLSLRSSSRQPRAGCRNDRSVALALSRHEAPAPDNRPLPITDMCALSLDAGVKLCVACDGVIHHDTRLECMHQPYCQICLQQLVNIAIHDKDQGMLVCPIPECRRAIAPGIMSQIVPLTSADVLSLRELCQTAEAPSFVRAIDHEKPGDKDLLLLHAMARTHKWARCTCGHVIERSHGCTHMRCRCGRHFCYGCNADLNETTRYTCKACRSNYAPAAAQQRVPAPRPPQPLPQRPILARPHACPICGKHRRSAKGGGPSEICSSTLPMCTDQAHRARAHLAPGLWGVCMVSAAVNVRRKAARFTKAGSVPSPSNVPKPGANRLLGRILSINWLQRVSHDAPGCAASPRSFGVCRCRAHEETSLSFHSG